jgi:hypothetical protein
LGCADPANGNDLPASTFEFVLSLEIRNHSEMKALVATIALLCVSNTVSVLAHDIYSTTDLGLVFLIEFFSDGSD